MKPLLFRFKIASLSLLMSGLLVVGFGVFFLATINRVGMARIDDEIRALGEPQVRGQHPPTHWPSFDRSLLFIYGDEPTQRFALSVLDTAGGIIFTSEYWPPELTGIPVPDLRPPPSQAADRAHRKAAPPGVLNPGHTPEREPLPDHGAPPFPRLDRDGHVVQSEVPRPPPDPREGLDGELGRSPGIPGPEPTGPGGFRRAPRWPPPSPKTPAFETHETLTGAWRVGFMGNEYVTLIVAADLTLLRRESVIFRNAFLIVTPVALLALGLAGWILASRALRPVAIITRTAETITARGLDRRVPATAADAELQRLVDVINRMLERLERSFLQTARFSADAAHELQTPLTVLQGELDNAVQQAVAGSEEQQRYSGLLEEVSGLKAVVQKLLLLARADVGQLPLSREDVDMSSLIQSAVEDVEAMAQSLTLEVNVPDGIHASVDADLVGQVVRNMTSNALKYGREGGTIRFDLRVRDATVFFTLANRGTAIPEDDRERIFDRFYRVDKARSRQTHGSGLGLSLAREIARAHGGDLVLDPYREGLISFTLTLPRDPTRDVGPAD